MAAAYIWVSLLWPVMASPFQLIWPQCTCRGRVTLKFISDFGVRDYRGLPRRRYATARLDLSAIAVPFERQAAISFCCASYWSPSGLRRLKNARQHSTEKLYEGFPLFRLRVMIKAKFIQVYTGAYSMMICKKQYQACLDIGQSCPLWKKYFEIGADLFFNPISALPAPALIPLFST